MVEITNYGPNLTVVTNYGCVDQFTISDSITIYPTPVADILFPPEEIDFGLYLFDGTNSIASEFNPSTYATPENFGLHGSLAKETLLDLEDHNLMRTLIYLSININLIHLTKEVENLLLA